MKAIVVYATITGNNEALADLIITNLNENNIITTKKEISLCDVNSLKEFDIIVIVPYTYDNGSLPEEGLDFYDDLNLVNLENSIYGVAGSGDVFYEDDYCVAVDVFSDKLKSVGSICGAPNLKINLFPTKEDTVKIKMFVEKLLTNSSSFNSTKKTNS